MFEFDPSIDGPTPEHVRWTLVHDCPLRAGTDISNPDQTERLLRALPYVSLAKTTDTMIGSLVINHADVAKVMAFDSKQVMAPFGDDEQVDRCCHGCPANVAKGNTDLWAHCFGTVALPVDPARRARLMEYLDKPPNNDRTKHLARLNVPNRWYQMWVNFQDDPTKVGQDELIPLIFDVWSHDDLLSESEKWSWALFFLALGRAVKQPNLRLAISLHPAGVTYDRVWQVDPHCIRCKASWPSERRQTCEMCGHQGGRQPSRTRKRIGTRPFRPIEDFVPADQIPAIIQEWSARWEKSSPTKEGQSLLGRFLATFSGWFRFGRGG